MKISLLKPRTLLFTAFSLLLALSSCDPLGIRGKGDVITMSFDETDFHGFDLSLSGDVEIRTGAAFKVEVSCEESVMPYVETKVTDGILKVYFNRDVYDVDHMKIVVTAPFWDNFDVSGSGDIVIPDTIVGNTLRMDVSGSGSIRATEALFDHAHLSVSGSGDLKLAGSAETLDADISGSGAIKCFDFVVNTAKIEVSGSGDAQVNVLESLDASISGSGTITYKGNPDVNARVSGSGNIRKF